MPLINCPDCGREVSDIAPTCLHCGRPMVEPSARTVQVRRKGGIYEAIGFLIIVAGIISYFWIGDLAWFLAGAGFIVFLIGRFM